MKTISRQYQLFDLLTPEEYQVLKNVFSCVTFGSANNWPDLATWGVYLIPLQVTPSSYDVDMAGQPGLAIRARAQVMEAKKNEY